MRPKDHDRHQLGTAGWLRAAVLGANDGIVSTSSLLLGLAAAHSSHDALLISGTAALVAGAMSMAAGEYVSVHSQADTEAAALAQERVELRDDFPGERRGIHRVGAVRSQQAERAVDISGHNLRIGEMISNIIGKQRYTPGAPKVGHRSHEIAGVIRIDSLP